MDNESRDMWAELQSVDVVEQTKILMPAIADAYDLEYTVDVYNYTLSVISEFCLIVAESMEQQQSG